MKRIVVFCGSSAGHQPIYMQQATLLGAALAKRNITLVYGGAKVGLMGAVADGALNAGGEVIGVLPHFLQQKELAHAGLTDLILVDTMHERKTKMNELCDGVIALPGGFGTMDELFEAMTLIQTNRMERMPLILFGKAFWTKAINIEFLAEQGTISPADIELLNFVETADEAWDQIKDFYKL